MGGKTDLKKFLRRVSKSGSSVVVYIMMILDAILKPVRRAWSDCQGRQQRRGDEAAASRDLEVGDTECERRRDSIFSGRRGSGRRDYRGMTHPDEYDVFENPWEKKSSLESLVGPRSVRVPTLGGDTLCGLDARDDEGLLLHPDVFDADQSEDMAEVFAEPTTLQHSPYEGLVPLRAISTLDLNATGNEDDTETGDIGENSITTAVDSTSADSDTTAAADPSSSSSSTEAEQPALPHWLVARKATAGPRSPRFVEGDVDGPDDIAPPDLEFLDQQGFTNGMMRAGLVRGSTWSPGQAGGEEEEEPSKPAARRLRPLSI